MTEEQALEIAALDGEGVALAELIAAAGLLGRSVVRRRVEQDAVSEAASWMIREVKAERDREANDAVAHRAVINMLHGVNATLKAERDAIARELMSCQQLALAQGVNLAERQAPQTCQTCQSNYKCTIQIAHHGYGQATFWCSAWAKAKMREPEEELCDVSLIDGADVVSDGRSGASVGSSAVEAQK